jgi:hypothetical protein
VRVTIFVCGVPPTGVATTVICEVPNAVAGATVTKVDAGDNATGDVATTVTVAGFGTLAGVVYSPLASIVPFAAPPGTLHVTL